MIRHVTILSMLTFDPTTLHLPLPVLVFVHMMTLHTLEWSIKQRLQLTLHTLIGVDHQ